MRTLPFYHGSNHAQRGQKGNSLLSTAADLMQGGGNPALTRVRVRATSCSSVGLEGKGALPKKILRFSWDPCIGLEEPAIRLSFRATGEINNCHFEPKARNLEFHFPQAPRRSEWGCRDCQSHGSRDSLQNQATVFAPYPLLSPDSGGASARRCSGQNNRRLRERHRPLSCPPRGAPLPSWGRGHRP
jgi:hypothetical protein